MYSMLRLFGAQPQERQTLTIQEYGLVKGLLQFDEYPQVKNQDNIYVEFADSLDPNLVQMNF